jgi:protein-tyrosine phosphatase
LTDRHLDWDGCHNVRDLGGLPTADGGRIRPGALVRADALERLSDRGWAALEAHGVRTVIDLRNGDEVGEDDAPRPAGITTVHLPLDGMEDTEFWEQWVHRPEFGTPHYYGPWLARFPKRAARVLAAIAHARPGGVAYHCGIGRDRTGLVTLLVLAFARVPPEVVAADYALSADRVPDAAEIDAFYDERATTPAEVVAGVLPGLDAEAYLRDAGLGVGDLAALRARVVEVS